KEILRRAARPAARHRTESASAVRNQFIVLPHFGRSPRLQIRIVRIGQALDVPGTDAGWTLAARIGGRFRGLIVEIVRGETDSATPLRIRSANGGELSINGEEIKAATGQPAEIGGGEVRNRTNLRSYRHGDADQCDQRHATEQARVKHGI